ncbi:MAG: hypothetical protein OQJ77_01635, partial [Thiovulaceae bacterium]|nr:hypothetical protein [Sulfurimonadaceae bacterium]
SSNTGVGNNVSSTLSGFYTPKDGDMVSTLAVFAGEGDKTAEGDSGSITDKGGTKHTLYNNPNNPSNDIMNASITNNGTYVTTGLPDYSQNSLGIDIDTFDVSDIIEHEQTSTEITFETDGDGYMPGMYALQTQLYVPSFCYDYKYTQNGTDITADFNASIGPRIYGESILTNTPIELIFYLKNLVDSDLYATDMSVTVKNINTAQLTYERDTTKRALNGELHPVEKTDSLWGTTVSDSYIKDIPIGTQYNSDYFYLYYKLNPQNPSINDPLNMEVSYNLVLDSGEIIPYTLTVNSQLPPCSTSSNNYTPARGRFNIVHTDTYNTIGKYNLPTQVTNREGGFSIISVDDDFSDTIDNLQDINTTVSVEMIDIDGFNLTDAACTQIDSNISSPIYLTFNGSSQMSFVSGDTASYYGTAKQNVAFRISYDVVNEAGDILETEVLPSGLLKLTNFPNYGGMDCNAQFDAGKIVTQVCGSNGAGTGNNGMTIDDFKACKQCIFGFNSRFVCSRDNFSIRPEAIMLKLNDQNQTNPASNLRIEDDISGVETPSGNIVNLAGAYNYILEVTATNHKDNTASNGYTKNFSTVDDSIKYSWMETTPVTCNDETDKTVDMYILNGYAIFNTSVPNVGNYNLSVIDTTWTAVDSNPVFRTHHNNDLYLQGANTLDCVADSSNTIAEGSAGMNGCNISSEHNSSGSTLKYRDYLLRFHPYKFDMSGITATTGINLSTLTTSSFIYMSDLNVSENMALHLNGDIKASGYDNTVLTNFTSGCYAQDIDIYLDNNVSVTSNPTYRYRYHNDNDISSDLNGTINTTNNFFTLPAANFINDQNASLSTKLHLNFDRRSDTAVNPIKVSYTDYNSSCTTASNCRFYADLISNKETEGVFSIDQNISHLYGRTNAPRQSFTGPQGNAFIYFESYCFGNGCNKSLLPNGTDSNSTNDPRWFVNTKHTINDGIVGNVSQRLNSKVTASTNPPTFANPTQAALTYDESSGYNYKTTMQNTPSSWLIYNRFNNAAISNEFEVEFTNSSNSWGGVDDASSTSKNSGASKTNRRIMW